MEVREESGKMTMMNGRVEIDMRPPFRSVKEAVSLFGEGALARNVQTRRLEQMNLGPDIETMTAELESTKQSLKKAKEETESMAGHLSTLKQELDKTKKELEHLKEHHVSRRFSENLKFIQDSPINEGEEEQVEFQKKRYVTFSHPTLSQIILPERSPSLARNSSTKKKKKSFTIPLVGGIFPKRKNKCDK